MAEVQQSSDATFRLFDWNRRGPDGRQRELHIEQSLASIDWAAGPANPIVPRPMDSPLGRGRGEHLASCQYFELDRFQPEEDFTLPGGAWSIWVILDGNAKLTSANERFCREFRRGESVLIPAAADELIWSISSADAPPTLLRARVPAKERAYRSN